MKVETVIGDIASVELKGVYQTPDGKFTFLTVDDARYRSTETIVNVPYTIAEMGWKLGETILATLTFNTAGRVIAVERND